MLHLALYWLYGQPLATDLSTPDYLRLAAVAKRLGLGSLFGASVAAFGFGVNGDNVCRLWKELNAFEQQAPGSDDEDGGEALQLTKEDVVRFREQCLTTISINRERMATNSEFWEVASEARELSPNIAMVTFPQPPVQVFICIVSFSFFKQPIIIIVIIINNRDPTQRRRKRS
jgi:hypothetical protein